MSERVSNQAWWDEREVAPGSGVVLRLGPLDLMVFNSNGEWQIAFEHGESDEQEGRSWSVETLHERPTALPADFERFVASSEGELVRFLPRSGDRPLVVRPRVPLHVLPGGETNVYVSAPIWVEVLVGRRQTSLRHVPTSRLSDTWVGATTLQGEVAYALATYARGDLERVARRPHRAITPIVIRNRGNDELQFDRVSLPVPFLSVFATEKGELWTEAVTLTRDADDEMAELRVSRGAPAEAKGGRQVSEPRERAESNVLVRAFSKMLRTLDQED